MANPADDLIQLSALIDGELDGIEAGRIMQRLENSAALQDEYRRTKAACELLERWDKIDCRKIAASPSFQARLLKRLRRLRASEHKPSSLIIHLSALSNN